MGAEPDKRSIRIQKKWLAVLILFLWSGSSWSQTQGNLSASGGSVVLARVKYSGGGDWYNDPSALPNLATYIHENTRVHILPTQEVVSLLDENLFAFPILFLTGHGKIGIQDEEADRLKQYLLKGGFLYADDDYGMDASFRALMKRIFPDRELKELAFEHPVYHIHFDFNQGPPKIHEHDNLPPRGLGIRDDRGRLMVYYTVESNLSDGWTDPEVHKDPYPVREKALQMGTNIILYGLMY